MTSKGDPLFFAPGTRVHETIRGHDATVLSEIQRMPVTDSVSGEVVGEVAEYWIRYDALDEPQPAWGRSLRAI